MYTNILIATDGSATAERAARVGADIAKATGASTLLLHVGDPQAGAAVLEKAAAQMGGAPRTMTVSGNPAEKIIDVAASEKADLIVIGNKGMTGAKRFMLGSVPNAVSHRAPCTVLIVKTT